MRFVKAAALAAAALITLAPAASANAYTVAVGGSTTVGTNAYTASTSAIYLNSDYGVPITCSSGTMQGNVQRGAIVTPPAASTIATITGTTWSGCLTPTLFNWQLNFTQVGTWNLRATSAPVNGVVSGRIDNIQMQVRSVINDRCEFDVSGSMAGSFNTNTQTLSINFSSNPLQVYDVVGCWGEFLDGDLLDLDADYAFTTTGGNLTFQ